MSHFSKIKTNISNLDILKKTVEQLGFNYELDSSYIISESDAQIPKKINIYNNSINSNYLFSFIWNYSEYDLLVDFQSWNLDIDFNFFIDKLSQQYAYNVILNKTISSGFQKVSEKYSNDGSIIITVQKWSS
uniref:Uncharacterized protein ycf35 n=1 Tax=Sonderella linearis TaxID=110477 RepID=A0A1Z1MM77_9FLOR|nr:hypothetical protein [Sonderella linearis]ARW66962.1 hypothetical protein [Sonderella linearis]